MDDKKTAGVIAFKKPELQSVYSFQFHFCASHIFSAIYCVASNYCDVYSFTTSQNGFFSFFFFCKFERIECVKDVGCCSSSSNSTIIKLNCDVNY